MQPARLRRRWHWLDASRRRKRPSLCDPCCRWSLSRAARTALVAVGVVEPRYKTNLAFRVLGRLTARPVSVGDLVSEGQTVGAIDPTALELAVRSAKAELTKAEAQLATARRRRSGNEPSSQPTPPRSRRWTMPSRREPAPQASVAHAQANLIKAIEQRGYAQIKADFAGVVTAVGAEVGQVVSPGQTVVTVARPDIREAVVDIGEDFPVPLEVGLPFTVGLQLLPAVQVEGKVREIAPQADAATRLRRVRIALNDPPDKLPPWARPSRRSSANTQSPTLRVPASAVLAKDGANFVWVVDQPAQHSVAAQSRCSPRTDAGARVDRRACRRHAHRDRRNP